MAEMYEKEENMIGNIEYGLEYRQIRKTRKG